jgi:hypothetical protein
MAWIGFGLLNLSAVSLLLAGVLVFQFGLLQVPITALWKMPSSPQATGRMVGGLLRTLPCTDVLGMLAAGVAWPWAFAGLAFLLPGPFLMKRFYST